MFFWKQGVPNIRSLPAGGLGKDAVLSEAKLHLGWACAIFLSDLACQRQMTKQKSFSLYLVSTNTSFAQVDEYLKILFINCYKFG